MNRRQEQRRAHCGADQIALFWEATAPTIYYPVIRSVTQMPGRDPTRNARLLAIAGQAMDDALGRGIRGQSTHTSSGAR
ncbi:MAG: hypothetical protein R3E68_21685 [Burkholderiaceae bacterium]